jgi:signal transduction histidine kinase
MVLADATADHDGMSPVRRAGAVLARLGLDTAYLVLGLPMGILTFTVVVTGWSTALALLITLIGIPIAVATIYASRWLAWIERRRAALVLGAPIPQSYRQPASGRFIDRLKALFGDPSTWKDLGWHLVLLPIGIAGSTIAIAGWGTAFGLITMPAWWHETSGDEPIDLALFHVDSTRNAWIACAIGVVALPVAAALVRGAAAGTAALAKLVLGMDRRELEERVEVLSESRAEAVDVAAAELQRIERDLHDGAQARLVALALDLGMAEDRFQRDPEGARELVEKARGEARLALGELRDLARGIRPALLAERGLGEALGALAARTPLPTTVEAEIDERLPAAVEGAVYFTAAEALTNAVKHAQARNARIRLWRAGGLVHVEVRDDGRGGAEPSGHGLDGLRKRLAALDGTLDVDSPAGGPTIVHAQVPCAS